MVDITKEYIIRVYCSSKDDESHRYPVADVRVYGPLSCTEEKFAYDHGGDSIEYIDLEDFEDYS